MPTVYQTNQQQINLPQIAFEMVRQVQHGNSRFQIRLDPAELGRVDVRLDIDKGGAVNARLIVDKAETLDLMQRDQRALQQALQQAGLDSSKTTLEFSLRQNNSGQQQNQQSGDATPVFSTEAPDELQAPSVKLFRGSLSASGINIFA
ncbi:flagellar hook-length control protein FliK [Devosia algicola]|uniref:Flagellar hook-length control protein FliK n=1 Tax=Devosia algicola TaxID=3026418 RepID=A0ABY7YSM2_9HYPH|nr:flagellar hook-length control protein FliK [Devosia algicola]WDR04187.1 flagellar hook-length control protein FliK [Devosia algicola]